MHTTAAYPSKAKDDLSAWERAEAQEAMRHPTGAATSYGLLSCLLTWSCLLAAGLALLLRSLAR